VIFVWDFELILHMADSASFLVLLKDRHNKLVWVNQRCIEEMGLPPRKEMIGKDPNIFLPNADYLLFSIDQEIMKKGIPKFNMINEIILPSGRKKWYCIDKLPIKNENGESVGIGNFLRDVTELVKTQQNLKRNNTLLRSILNINRILTKQEQSSCYCTEVHRILVDAECYEEMLFYVFEPCSLCQSQIISSPELEDALTPYFENKDYRFFLTSGFLNSINNCPLLLKKEDLQAIGLQIPEKYSEHSVALAPMTNQGKTCGIMFAILPKDVEFEDEERMLFEELANSIAYAINVRDIDAQLRKERTFLEKLFETSPEGVVLCKPSGEVVNANSAFCSIFGFDHPSLVVGKNIDDLIADDKIRTEALALTDAGASGKSVAIESVRIKADGTPLNLSILVVPVKIKGEIVGVYAIYRDITDRVDYEKAILENFKHMSIAWRQTVELLVAVSELRDPYTSGHQKRVAEIAKFIAMNMELSPTQVDAVEMAALIHDIGKIKVPAEILSKPGPLDEVEYLLVKTHPMAGYNLLKNVDFPWPIAEIVLQHHERLDGSGYPLGLRGEEIRLESRIIAVADVLEAMTSDRPYRKALDIEQALNELKCNRGKLYGEEAVDACLSLYKDGILRPWLELYKI